MTWNWPSDPRSYQAVNEHIRLQTRDWLEEVYAEWEANEDGRRNEDLYERALELARDASEDTLASYIWEKTRDHADGKEPGGVAHCCPFACEAHAVNLETDDVREAMAE